MNPKRSCVKSFDFPLWWLCSQNDVTQCYWIFPLRHAISIKIKLKSLQEPSQFTVHPSNPQLSKVWLMRIKVSANHRSSSSQFKTSVTLGKISATVKKFAANERFNETKVIPQSTVTWSIWKIKSDSFDLTGPFLRDVTWTKWLLMRRDLFTSQI